MQETKTYPMTRAGEKILQQKLYDLQTTQREEVTSRIKRAREFCDFQEDSAYEAAIKEQLALEQQIAYMKEMLQHKEIIVVDRKSGKVTIGSEVSFKLLPNGIEETYTIVGTAEANLEEGKISNESKLALQLIGHMENDVVTISTPEESYSVLITNIQ